MNALGSCSAEGVEGIRHFLCAKTLLALKLCAHSLVVISHEVAALALFGAELLCLIHSHHSRYHRHILRHLKIEACGIHKTNFGFSVFALVIETVFLCSLHHINERSKLLVLGTHFVVLSRFPILRNKVWYKGKALGNIGLFVCCTERSHTLGQIEHIKVILCIVGEGACAVLCKIAARIGFRTFIKGVALVVSAALIVSAAFVVDAALIMSAALVIGRFA